MHQMRAHHCHSASLHRTPAAQAARGAWQRCVPCKVMLDAGAWRQVMAQLRVVDDRNIASNACGPRMCPQASSSATGASTEPPAEASDSSPSDPGGSADPKAVAVSYRQQRFRVPAGTKLRTAMLLNGVSPHNGRAQLINCRGLGTCGTCAVEIARHVGWGDAPAAAGPGPGSATAGTDACMHRHHRGATRCPGWLHQLRG